VKHTILIILAIVIGQLTKAQEIDLSNKWTDLIESNSEFKDINIGRFNNLDFSNILSNQLRFDNDPFSTYIGIFGPNYRRIDFHLKTSKNNNNYSLTGKSKLGDNVRELKGELKLNKVLLKTQNYITDSLYIGLFDCKFQEPGDRSGDGMFSGVFTVVFYIKDNEIKLFKTSSGDEPNFTNTFVGKWTKNNSEVERRVIFSFHAAGLYERLPFCEEIYTYEDFEDFVIIKEKYKKFGWTNYNPDKTEKSNWWK